jgi:hypothetical protein
VLLRILLLALLPASVSADAGKEGPECVEDAALSLAAAELLLVAERPPAGAALTRAVRAAGSDAVFVRAYLLRDADASRARGWLAQFERTADAPAVCGFARSERGQLLLVTARAGALAPLAERRAVLRGSVIDGFSDPEIVVEDAGGGLQRFAVDRAQLARGIAVSDRLARPLRVQLLARGPAGPRPIAERDLPGSDDSSPVPSEAEAGERAGDRPVSERLSALRRERGLPPLRDNRLLAAVAAAHAQRVCEDGRIAHELEPGDGPEQRVRRAGIRARSVGETVARAASASAAFGAFDRSPSHRLTLLGRAFTDVGVGQGTDAQRRTCVVVLLAAWPRYVGR